MEDAGGGGLPAGDGSRGSRVRRRNPDIGTLQTIVWLVVRMFQGHKNTVGGSVTENKRKLKDDAEEDEEE